MALFAWKEGYKCGKQRQHVARECPQKVDEQDQMHANKKGGVVNEKWILLDSQSTVNQVSNPTMLTSMIRKAKNPSTIHCNAGSTRSMFEGELFGKMTVMHDPHGIAHVLSLNDMKKRHRVTYDSDDRGGVFQVHTEQGIVEFKPSNQGLHYHDVSDKNSNFEMMLVNTVRENFEGYSRHEVKKAKDARRIQGMIANPTEREFAGMPVTDAVIKQVEEMAVKDGAIKGIIFKDRKRIEYEFDNDEEYEMLVEPDEPAPFPDIPADAPGMLTELEEEYGIDDVVQDESEMSDEQ